MEQTTKEEDQSGIVTPISTPKTTLRRRKSESTENAKKESIEQGQEVTEEITPENEEQQVLIGNSYSLVEKLHNQLINENTDPSRITKAAQAINKELARFAGPQKTERKVADGIIISGAILINTLGLFPPALDSGNTFAAQIEHPISYYVIVGVTGTLVVLPVWALASRTMINSVNRLIEHPVDLITLGYIRRRDPHFNRSLHGAFETLAQTKLLLHGSGAAVIAFTGSYYLIQGLPSRLSFAQHILFPGSIATGISALSTNLSFLNIVYQAQLNDWAAQKSDGEDYRLRISQARYWDILQTELEAENVDGKILADFMKVYKNPPAEIEGTTLLIWKLRQLDRLFAIMLPEFDFKKIEQADGYPKLKKGLVGLALLTNTSYITLAIDAVSHGSILQTPLKWINWGLGLWLGYAAFSSNTLVNSLKNIDFATRIRRIWNHGISNLWQQMSNRERVAVVVEILLAATSSALIGIISYQFPLIKEFYWAIAQAVVALVGSLPLTVESMIAAVDAALYSLIDSRFNITNNYMKMDEIYQNAGVEVNKSKSEKLEEGKVLPMSKAEEMAKDEVRAFLCHVLAEEVAEIRRLTGQVDYATMRMMISPGVYKYYADKSQQQSNRYSMWNNELKNIDNKLQQTTDQINQETSSKLVFSQ